MGLLAALLLLASGATTEPSAGDALSRLKIKAEACISSNAPSVERAEQSLSAAAAFLVDYACIEEIGAFERYEVNSKTLIALRGRHGAAPMQMSDEAKAQFRATSEREETIYKALSISPETGELIFPSGLDFDETPNAFAFLTASGSRVDVSSRFRALAGRAVLDAHQSRLDH